MNEKPEIKNIAAEKDKKTFRLDLDKEKLEKALRLFKLKIKTEDVAYLNACVHCGLCADSCHYFLTDKNRNSIPGYKLGLLRDLFNRENIFLGKIFPRWIGARDLNEDLIENWIDSLFGRCSLCGRCSLNCPMGINIAYLIRLGRGVLSGLGLVPESLQRVVDIALEKGNNMGIDEEEWKETVKWLEEELRKEVNDPAASLPLDRKGAKILYVLNPREPMFFPLSLLAAGKIFYAAKESWTLSTKNFDVTNYGFYTGDDESAAHIAKRLVSEMEKLKIEILVLSECGHGFNSNRWEAPEWLRMRYDFEVKSILEVIASYLRQGRIKLDPAKNQKIYTLHDPCNLVRFGGVIEEQRYILKNSVLNFKEMNPNREKNFCCGGGGGQLSLTPFAERRIKAGKIKAEQIRKTGAQVVVAPCHNCIDQIMELNKHYDLRIEVLTVAEVVASALKLNRNRV